MINVGSHKTEYSMMWTVVTQDHELSAQYEHILNRWRIEILTLRSEEDENDLNNNVLRLLSDLMKFESVTDDTGCQKYISISLDRFKTYIVWWCSNMISTLGTGSPCAIFVGHTDVVLRNLSDEI